MKIENSPIVKYLYLIFCKCGWGKYIIPDGTEVNIACDMIKQEAELGCRFCGGEKLHMRNANDGMNEAM
jgi:hypothetical protein